MKKSINTLLILLAIAANAKAQDTFSIVGIDSLTREVGSAGASCIDLFNAGISDDSFLSDLLPDTGAINTQASYLAANQNNARTRMRAGDTPSQIINWLITHDAGSNPNSRQYGVVGFTGTNVSTAAYTGTSCFNYKNHITGNTGRFHYSIQGNILLGQQVLDSMEARFIRAQGDLACKLMAALQGAKMIGADARCSSNNTSSLFAFVRVAKPTDSYGNPSFKVSVRTHNTAQIEPIDSLQVLFNQLNPCNPLNLKDIVNDHTYSVYPNPAKDEISLKVNASLQGLNVSIIDVYGCILWKGKIEQKTVHIDLHSLSDGVYFIQIENSKPHKFIRQNK